MNRIIKASLSIFSAAVLITACSSGNVTNPIAGSAGENETPSEPKLFHAAVSDNLADIKAGSPVKSFTGACGEELSVDSAVNVIPPDYETSSNYAYLYDYAYLTYNTSIYERDSLDPEKSIFFIKLDSSELTEKYNEYLNNKSNVYTVKRGDKLQNGLICTDAKTGFYCNNDGAVSLLTTEACFSGELTLTGTLRCLQEEDPIAGKGALAFIPDADNGNIPARYEMSLPEKAEIDSTQLIYESFQLGNISELPEEYALLIKDNEYTDVQITIKDIHLSLASNKTDFGSSAVIVDMKAI